MSKRTESEEFASIALSTSSGNERLSKISFVNFKPISEKCKKCGACLRPGCPALTKNADGTISIDETMCNGCGLCKSLCKFEAIE